MNPPAFTPPGGNAQAADPQTMAAVKSVRLSIPIRTPPPNLHALRDEERQPARVRHNYFKKLTFGVADASTHGILPREDCCLGRDGFRPRRRLRPLHGIRS